MFNFILSWLLWVCILSALTLSVYSILLLIQELRGMDWNHRYLFHYRYVMAYVNGSYCKLEVDFFCHTFQLFTLHKKFNYFNNGGKW
jgi:hypothetical protein